MLGAFEIFLAVLPVFAAMAIGFVARRVKILDAESDRSLLALTIQVLSPCLILHSMLGNPALRHISDVAVAPLLGFGTVAVGVALAYAVSMLFTRDRAVRGTFAVSTGIFNYGFIAIPLALRFFDRETVGMLFVFNVGVEVALWVFGALLMSGAPLSQSIRKAFSAPVITIIAALILNFIGLADRVPAVLLRTFDFLGEAAIPLSLVLTGATMFDHLKEFTGHGGVASVTLGSILRLGLIPLIFFAGVLWLPLPEDLRKVLALQAAMPAAMFPVIMAKHYGGSTSTALRIVLATSLLGLITIPLWLRFALSLLGMK